MTINYDGYRPPGADVMLEFERAEAPTSTTEFLTVVVGSGVSTRTRKVVRENIKADITDFPKINLTWEVNGEFNFQQYASTAIELLTLSLQTVTAGGTTMTPLTKGVDYEVEFNGVAKTYEGKIVTTIKALSNKITAVNAINFSLELMLTMEDEDFEIRTVDSRDRMRIEDVFGQLELREGEVESFNDMAMAAEIAFKTGVQRFMYLEVPRNYGEKAKPADYMKAIEKIYHENNAWRIVPLTDDPTVVQAVSKFVTVISNPTDRRECVGFITKDNNDINDHTNLDELVLKVGGLSRGINNKRVVNIYGGWGVDFPIADKTYTLPFYFMAVAVAFLDNAIGMSLPISTREVSVFSKLHGPKFRPLDWNDLAETGVFIVFQERRNGPIVIRHQLTTERGSTSVPAKVEYSVVKNMDATIKLVRDRLSPYAGKENITDGFFEKVDAAFTTAKTDAINFGYVKDLQPLSPWELRKVSNGINVKEIVTNVVSRHRYIPLYPGNNIDVEFIV